MLDGLIISADKRLFDEFALHFSTELTAFEYSASVKQAEDLAKIQTFDYIIAADSSAEEIFNMLKNLLELESYKNLPVLCLHSYSTVEDRKKLWELGVRDILHLPISREELSFELEKFLDDYTSMDSNEPNVGMHGKLGDYSLLDIVQTLEQSKKTGILVLHHDRNEGRIWFKNGEIYDARLSAIENIEAILKMSTWMEGDFAITFVNEDYERKILVDNQQILIDTLQHMDLRNKLLNSLPPQDESLLISPETDIYKVGEEEIEYLRYFQGGQTIREFLSAFMDNEVVLLEKVKGFIEKKILMTREEFDSYTTEAERELAEAGLKNMFKKLFKGKPHTEVRSRKLAVPGEKTTVDVETGESEIMDVQKEYLFQAQGIEFDKFKQLIKNL